MPLLENILYYAGNVLTLGMPWMVKIVIKKAVMEANNATS